MSAPIPKEFYNCCNGDSVVGHKVYCIKSIMDQPAYHVWVDNPKNPAVMFVAIPLKYVADEYEKGSTCFLEGFMMQRLRDAMSYVSALFNQRKQATQSKIIVPNSAKVH